MNKYEARLRWQRPEWRVIRDRAATLISRRGLVPKDLESFVPKTEAGLFDLRGIPLLEKSELLKVRKASFQDVDLSFAEFGRVLLEQCGFENVNLSYMEHSLWNERGCRFRNVDLQHVKFKNAAIGLEGSTYERVNFSNCAFGGTSSYRAQFHDCVFCIPRLKKVDFLASNFVRCTFCGRLESVWFRRVYPHAKDETHFGKAPPNEMQDIDFSQATFWDVTFTGGLDLSKVVLPNDGFHALLVHFRRALLKSKEYIETRKGSGVDMSDALLQIRGYLTHAEHQDMWILNQRDLETDLGNEVGSTLFSLLVEFDKSG